MALPLLALAASLAAEFAPGLIRALAGNKAAETAETVVKMAEKVTGYVIGQESDVDAVAAALRTNPEQLVAFRRAMAQIELDFERLAVADRDSARRMQIDTKSRMPAVLAILIVLLFTGEMVALFAGFMPPDEASRTAIIKGISLLEIALTLMLGFYYGTSASSQRKDGVIAARR